MEDRGERRNKTLCFKKRAFKIFSRMMASQKLFGFNARENTLGCRCRRVQRGLSPKIQGSLCHCHNGGYHPCVQQRIAGKRLARKWEAEWRGGNLEDVEI